MTTEPEPEGVPEEGNQELSGLVHIEFGLQPFTPAPACPKCCFNGVRVSYHSNLILNIGPGEYPCGSWYRSGFLTGEINEHLCMRCARCQYGWPTQTGDTYRADPESPVAFEEGT